MLSNIPASTGWTGKTVTLTVPQEVKDGLQTAAAVGDLITSYQAILRAAVTVIESAIPLYTDPVAAAVDQALAAFESLLTSFSPGAVKMIVLSDTPELAKALTESRAYTAEEAKAAATSFRESFYASAGVMLNPTGGDQRTPLNVLKQQITAQALNQSLSASQPALLSIRDQLLASLADINDPNVPGVNGETFGVGLSLVTYGDAAAIDALVGIIKLYQELVNGFRGFNDPPAPVAGLPAPTGLKARNGSKIKGVNQVLLSWTQNLPTEFPLTVDGVIWAAPTQILERSFDGVTWTELKRWELLDEYPKPAFSRPQSNSYVDTALNTAINTRVGASLPVGIVRYRVRYRFMNSSYQTADVYGPQVFYTPGSKAAGPTVPPDWLSLGYSTQLSLLTDQIPLIREQIAATADQEKKALQEQVKAVKKKIAKIEAIVANVLNFIDKLNALLGNLGSASVAVRTFDLTGLSLSESLANGVRLEKVNINSLTQASKTPLTAKLYQEYATSMTQLNSYVVANTSTTTFDGGLGVFFVVDSALASGVLELITALLGLGTGVAATSVSVGEQMAGLWETAANTSLNLPPTPEPLATPNPAVSVGESDSSLNIAPATGTYERPLLGETDYPGADLNCPPK